ncbi:MAG: glycosyltransferase family 4 protein [Candidatus Paracaedimonas acanthamoebae]|uniref:Glycosyltransferase family 4 protein n=1 Tax=Candidatus Paracaedimonas acanthamoebae TaxID=244581 RepID=A0A8J7TSN5_9PROT|nr:glycosyltransferase family 4 protein [Candidatus Paracaedimonas acanthamoebae]
MSKKSKRLLYFVSEDWYFCTHRLPLAKAALAAGYEVFLITCVSYCQEQIEEAGIKLIPLHHFNRSSGNLKTEFLIFKELNQIYKNISPDLVHHVAMKPVIYGSLIAWLNKIPRIINAFGGLGHLFTHPNLKTQVLREGIQIILKILLNRPTSTLILQNEDDAKLLLDRQVIKKDHLVIIKGVGVNTQIFSFQEESKIDEKKGPIISFVSRMLKDKGILELIEAIRILRSQQLKAQFHFWGDIDPLNPSSITCHDLNNWQKEGLITWHGPTKEVASVYHKSHLIVLPSYREGLPKTLLEAASCGRAIITTDVPGCREIIQNKKNGLLVPARNYEALAEALQELITNPSLRKKMGKQGRQMIECHFLEETIIQQTLQLYLF